MSIGFRGMHPATNFIFFCAVCFISLYTSHPALLAVSFLSGFCYDIKLRGRAAVKSMLCFLMPMTLLISALNPVFSHYGVTTLFVMHSGNNFTLEALVYGFILAVKTVCILLWLNCFNEVVSAEKFIDFFGRVSPRLALMFSMALRFLPMFRSQLNEIEISRRGLGISYKSTGMLTKIKNGARILSILISWLMEHAADTAASMSARGYAVNRRTSYSRYQFSTHDKIMTAAFILGILPPIIFQKAFDAVYNPVIEVDGITIRALVSVLTFAMVCLIPFIYDITQERLWSISK